MKPISSVIIFLLLVCSAVWAGFDSYHGAETAIVQDRKKFILFQSVAITPVSHNL